MVWVDVLQAQCGEPDLSKPFCSAQPIGSDPAPIAAPRAPEPTARAGSTVGPGLTQTPHEGLLIAPKH